MNYDKTKREKQAKKSQQRNCLIFIKEGGEMEQILNTQLFGLLTIIIFYNIGLFIQKKLEILYAMVF